MDIFFLTSRGLWVVLNLEIFIVELTTFCKLYVQNLLFFFKFSNLLLIYFKSVSKMQNSIGPIDWMLHMPLEIRIHLAE